LISSGIDALHIAILENLSSKSLSLTIISFRHNIFHHIFYNKGTTSDDGKYIFLNKEDFSRCSWPANWYQVLDQLGDGVKLRFPAKVRLFLSRSPRNHALIKEQMQPLPRYYIEKLSIQCQKQPLTISIVC
jgi:hypothetical protein